VKATSASASRWSRDILDSVTLSRASVLLRGSKNGAKHRPYFEKPMSSNPSRIEICSNAVLGQGKRVLFTAEYRIFGDKDEVLAHGKRAELYPDRALALDIALQFAREEVRRASAEGRHLLCE
jgi:hypothetical protein